MDAKTCTHPKVKEISVVLVADVLYRKMLICTFCEKVLDLKEQWVN